MASAEAMKESPGPPETTSSGQEVRTLAIRPKAGVAEGGSDDPKGKTRLQLLDLPDDILREIVKQVGRASIHAENYRHIEDG